MSKDRKEQVSTLCPFLRIRKIFPAASPASAPHMPEPQLIAGQEKVITAFSLHRSAHTARPPAGEGPLGYLGTRYPEEAWML